jgi:hypothetical protein
LLPGIEISQERISTEILHAIQIGTADIGLISGHSSEIGVEILHGVQITL